MQSITRVGIDASKDNLDVLAERPQDRIGRFGNDLEGIGRLKSFLGDAPCLVAIEASGRYEALVRRELEACGHTVKVQNPRQVRRLAQGLGVQAKTDRLDAQVLARTADLCAPNAPRSKEREQLGDLSRSIECLKKERSGHLKRIQAPGFSPVAAKAVKRVVAALERQIQNLEAEFARLVKAGPLGERFRLAQTIPCVGPNLARVAVCELPDNLEEWSVRQLSAYAGVAPVDDSSGRRTSPSRLPKHKNIHLKAALYMPAMGLMKNSEWAGKQYARLRSKGLTHQQAIVPIMHKLLFHIAAVLKRGSAWQPEPPQRT